MTTMAGVCVRGVWGPWSQAGGPDPEAQHSLRSPGQAGGMLAYQTGHEGRAARVLVKGPPAPVPTQL